MRGLGAGQIVSGTTVDTGFGWTVDCSNTISYALNSGCWQKPLSWWQAMKVYPAPPPPVPPAAPSTQGQMTGAESWTPDQALAATYQAQTQQNLDFFGQVSSNIAKYDCSNFSQLFTDTNEFVSNCSSSLLWLIGGVAVLLLVVRR